MECSKHSNEAQHAINLSNV